MKRGREEKGREGGTSPAYFPREGEWRYQRSFSSSAKSGKKRGAILHREKKKKEDGRSSSA